MNNDSFLTIMKNLSRKQREYAARRAEILLSAERVFAQNGFHNSTMSQIANESEFAIGTLYQFFANKEELYYTMMTEKFDLLYTTLKGKISDYDDFLQKLNCLIYEVLGFIEQNVDFFKIFTWELNVLKSDMENKLKQDLISKHFAYIKLISDVITGGVQDGVLIKRNAKDLSTALVGMLNVFSFNWVLNKQKQPLRKKSDLILNLFLHGAGKTG